MQTLVILAVVQPLSTGSFECSGKKGGVKTYDSTDCMPIGNNILAVSTTDLLNIIQPIATGKVLGLYLSAKSLGQYEKNHLLQTKTSKQTLILKDLS